MGDGEPPRLVQHVILRKDLTKAPFSWPAGSMVAQGCHVVSKTLWELKDEHNVQVYMADIDNMHKVTLAAKDEEELRAVLDHGGPGHVDHHEVALVRAVAPRVLDVSAPRH